ncbi:amidohydrolase family protein [Streptomyces sp. cg40]|uniref:amidohydrolase family protein n=1 Tax=Streptomyces sp. cg40 TaxID=3419764 RepID=UPI003CFEF0BE
MPDNSERRSSAPVVFTGVRLVDGTGGPPVESAAVVVEDGRFTYAGPEHARPQVRGATVVDCRGRTLLPGFFDCHLHFLMDSNADFTGRLLTNRPTVTVFERARRMRETLHAGITTARDLGGIDAGYRDAVALGPIEGPRLHVALRLMSHTGGHVDFSMPSGYDPSALLEPFSELADDPGQVRLATRRLLRDGRRQQPEQPARGRGPDRGGDRDGRGRDPTAPGPAGRRPARRGDQRRARLPHRRRRHRSDAGEGRVPGPDAVDLPCRARRSGAG